MDTFGKFWNILGYFLFQHLVTLVGRNIQLLNIEWSKCLFQRHLPLELPQIRFHMATKSFLCQRNRMFEQSKGTKHARNADKNNFSYSRGVGTIYYKNRPTPASFSFIFGLFQSNIQFGQQIM